MMKGGGIGRMGKYERVHFTKGDHLTRFISFSDTNSAMLDIIKRQRFCTLLIACKYHFRERLFIFQGEEGKRGKKKRTSVIIISPHLYSLTSEPICSNFQSVSQ